MGTAERRQREREQRRIDIIDAAERIIFSKGLSEATMDEIAETAELSKGTLYLYFESKDDLYMAIVFRGLGILTGMFKDAVSGCDSGIEMVRAIGQAYIEFYNRYPDYFKALVHYHGQKTDYFSDKEPLEILIAAIRKGIDDGSLRSDLDPGKTAIILWGQTTGILQISSMWCKAIEDSFAIDTADIIAYYFEHTAKALRAE